MNFKIHEKDGMARTGEVETRNGSFNVPAFIPVATSGAVRALDGSDLNKMDAEVVFANTYHLYLRPGDKLVSRMGGLHRFMNFDKPIITDSGGFQVFSLGYGMEHGVGKIADNIFLEGMNVEEMVKANKKGNKWARVEEDGVTFKNPLTGEVVRLTPQKSMEIQSNLDSDIIFAFDECTSPLSDKQYTEEALERTHRWEEECLETYNREQELFGIVQGGEYRDLRERSAQFVAQKDFAGFGVGGSLGKSKVDMHNILEWVIPYLPEEKPRHLLGIGAVEDMFNSVERGIDMFDCVAPTRWARRGHLYVSPEEGGTAENKFRINIRNAQFKEDEKPIDRSCNCFVCRDYSRAYLRHLFNAEELTYFRLSSYHNVNFLLRLMEKIRESINKGYFQELKKEWLGY